MSDRILYRAEIDGLRAIAVSAVVLFHAGLGGAGFVGVDVFFVISGYLITSLLLREREGTGRIDLAAFYARRVRRIFPAATVLVLAVLALAPLLLAPPALSSLGASAAAASVFGANVYFQMTTGGYFDTSADLLPLLHLWSLSVEEQFYLLWPALLMLVPRRWLGLALVVLALGSFGLAEVLKAAGGDAAFYLMPARAWELAAGAIVATLPATLPRGLLPAGLALTLAACVFTLGDFPGVGALPAVLGASLVVAGVHGGERNRLLASRPMVGLGLISYSLYLWHWPLLALYRAVTIGEPAPVAIACLMAAALVLAALSYRYVEQPGRRLRWPSRRLVTLGAAASMMLALGAWSYAERAASTVPVGSEAAAQAAAADKLTVQPPTPGAAVVTWGDSYAGNWQQLGWTLGAPAATYARNGCPPLLGSLPSLRTHERPACEDHNRRALAAALRADTVVLAIHWQRYPVADLGPTLAALKGVRRVIVIAPTPELRDELPRCLRAGVDCSVPRLGFELQARPYRAALERAAAGLPNVAIFDPTDRLCSRTLCAAVKDGVPLYNDRDHLSAHGVALLLR